MKPLAFSLLFALASCASTQELALEHDATCRSYGPLYATHDYYDCRMRFAEMHERKESSIINAIASGMVTATVGIIASLNVKALLTH